ncbi:radical SAM protein [Methylocystis parvus]|uniref:radical SAM protein n=1 Tax=Methylocystis parvus TaxID=134 RepID=UPI003C746A7D
MQNYVVSNRITFRRESFGAITLHRKRQETRFFNLSAAAIIESCREAKSIGEIVSSLPAQDIESSALVEQFLHEQCENGILERSAPTEKSQAAFFYSDVGDFPDDHLYFPLGVEIELTLKCMRSCRYCAYDAHPKAQTESELTFSEWSQILEDIARNGAFFVRFTGGDPLLRADFEDIVRKADALGLIITVGSDLTALTDAHIELLSNLENLYALQTTLDGSVPQQADSLRGAGNFEAVIDGVQRLRRRDVPVIVGTVVNARNAADIYETAKLVGRLGANGYCAAPLYAAGRGTAAALRHLLPSNSDLATAARGLHRAVSEGLVAPADPAWLEATQDAGDRLFDDIWSDQGVLARRPDALLRIDPMGRAYTSIKLKPALSDSVYLGNVRDKAICELWTSSDLITTLRERSKPNDYFGDVVDIREMQN